MKNRTMFLTAAAVAGLTSLSACGGSTEPDVFSSTTGAQVEVIAQGGIAALSITDKVNHDSRAYVHVQRQICTTTCPAPTDSASGVLTASKSDSLFAVVFANAPGLKDDYGLTGSGADMFAYTVRISTSAGTKTIRADDGTMPQQLRAIVSAVRSTISAARQ